MARLDSVAAQIALRARALTLSVCTTGSTTLGTSAAGFTRSSGSFISDGFFAGEEVTPTGFPSTARKIITDVTSTLLTVDGGMSVLADSSGRTLTVGLPERRLFENRRVVNTDTIAPYVEEEYVPRPPALRSFPASGGTLYEYGEWIIRWYGLQNYDVPGMRKSVDALLALFTPGTQITAGDHTLMVQGSPSEPGPFAGQFLRSGNYMVCTIRIPFWALATNVIAA